MSRFNDDKGGEVARKMKFTGDRILRPMILSWIDRLKDPKFRSIMDIGGNEGTWSTNPEAYLESKQFWKNNFKIYYPYRRSSKGASSFPPVPIRSSDWISLRCRKPNIINNCITNYRDSIFGGSSCQKTEWIGGQDR